LAEHCRNFKRRQVRLKPQKEFQRRFLEDFVGYGSLLPLRRRHADLGRRRVRFSCASIRPASTEINDTAIPAATTATRIQHVFIRLPPLTFARLHWAFKET